MGALRGLADGRQATAFAVRGVPDLLDEALVALDAELDHDIHEQVEELLDVRAGQLLPSPALLDEGHSLKDIATQLNLSVKTVDAHKVSLMRKLDLHDRSELIRYAIRRRLVEV